MEIDLGLGVTSLPVWQRGVSSPRIVLSANTLPENSPEGTAIGTLSVVGATGTAVFTLTDSSGNQVKLAGTNNVDLEAGATEADYETTQSFQFTVSVSGVTPAIPDATLTVVVTNVLEVTLADLTLDNDSFTVGAEPGTVIGSIVGKTAGSTLSIVPADPRVALSGTDIVVGSEAAEEGSFSVTVREVHADASNSPRDSVIELDVLSAAEPPPAPILDWTSDSSVTSPQFNVDIDSSVGEGDKFQLEYQTAGGDWSGATVVNHAFTGDEDLTATIAMEIGDLADGDYDVRCRVAFAASPTTWSDWSNVETITILFVASPTVFFSATDKHSTISRSDQGLTVTWTDSGPFANARVNADISGLRIYCEFLISVTGSLILIGATRDVFDVSGSHLLGTDANGFGWNSASQNIIFNNLGVGGTPSPGATGDIVSLAIDDRPGQQKIWIRLNGGAWAGSGGVGDPENGVHGASYSGIGSGPLLITLCGKSPTAATANFGFTAFTYTPPVGFAGLE